MDERAVLDRLAGEIPAAGDDAAVIDGLVITTDMLHQSTDLPQGTSHYTAGWRSVGASLSDIAAMGANPVATVAVYGAPTFEWDEIDSFVTGAMAVNEACDSSYVGGDLDQHDEFTIATTAIGRATDPVYRSGATIGDTVCVTGTLGRSAAALELFESGDVETANELFQFTPRVEAGRVLADRATALIDSSDGLARSLYQLAAASQCGFALESPIPIDEAVESVATTEEDRREMGLFFGEDFELVCTIPPDAIPAVREKLEVPLYTIGSVTESGVTLDGEEIPDRGYAHGSD